MNILVVPGTNLIAREICNSISIVKGIHLYGAGFDRDKAVQYPYEGFDFLESWDNEKSLIDLAQIIESRKIDVIYPAHDSWILGLRNHDHIHGARILKSTSNSIGIASYKSLTYRALNRLIPTPVIYLNVDEVQSWPIFIKPDRGQGSIGSKILKSVSEANRFVDNNGNFRKDFVASEYLPGNEYTIDCFSDTKSHVIFASARLRSSVQSGMAVETQILSSHSSLEWAEKISSSLDIVGAWFFQAKEDDKGDPKLMEVGVRIAGASGVLRLKGVNLSLLNILQIADFELKVLNQPSLPQVTESQLDLGFLYKEIYVDFDDTLIVKGKRNFTLIKFLQKSKSQGTRISLVTKHLGNIDASLELYGLQDLFDNVSHLESKELKSDFMITNKNFIFIDDSFRERLEVSQRFGDKALVLDETAFERGIYA